MRSVHKAAALTKAVIETLIAACIPTAAVIAFSFVFKAEGPVYLLYGWTGLSVLLLTILLRMRRSRLISGLTAIVLTAGALTVLVQVNVAKRSLAEAWLALARNGRAFGFFSFFAAELYALFIIAIMAFALKAWLTGMKGRALLRFGSGMLASNSLCAGIILGNQALLFLALAAVIPLLLAQGEESIDKRLKAAAFPLAFTVCAALLFSFVSGKSAREGSPMRYPDLSGIFNRLAPSFPLLRDVPGYGYTIGAAEMPAGVYLTDRKLFAVRGEPNTTHYLSEKKYARWTGELWEEDPDPGREIPAARSEGVFYPRALTLRLMEDFYSAFPVMEDTSLAIWYGTEVESAAGTLNGGIAFTPDARRGLTVELVQTEGERLPLTEEALPSLRYYLGEGDKTGQAIKDLSRSIRANSSSDIAFLAGILDHLSSGYAYALQTKKAPRNADPVEYFLFEKKEGFCLYFASAFVLLARQGGIPARLAEGFFTVIDERGEGVITGNSAHAWAEVFIDGKWRIMEATPPFAGEDPFQWVRDDDAASRRHIASLFGDAPVDQAVMEYAEGRRNSPVAPALLASLALAAGVVMFTLWAVHNRTARSRAQKKLKRKARALVRAYARKGIPEPEITGWLAWKEQAACIAKETDEKKAAMVLDTADRIIRETYGA